MSNHTVRKLLHHWSRAGATVLPAATDAEITAFEKKNDVSLPFDLRSYYQAANGFGLPGDQDTNGFSFWPLSRVSPLATFEGGSWAHGVPGFIFADYLSLSWGYAFVPDVGNTSARYCLVGTADGEPIWIAEDFASFVELYLRDDRRLYPPA